MAGAVQETFPLVRVTLLTFNERGAEGFVSGGLVFKVTAAAGPKPSAFFAWTLIV